MKSDVFTTAKLPEAVSRVSASLASVAFAHDGYDYQVARTRLDDGTVMVTVVGVPRDE